MYLNLEWWFLNLCASYTPLPLARPLTVDLTPSYLRQRVASNDSSDHTAGPTVPQLPPTRPSPSSQQSRHHTSSLPPARPANSPPVQPPPSPPRSRSPTPLRHKATPPLPDLRSYSQSSSGEPTPRPGGGNGGGSGSSGGRAGSAPPSGGYNSYDERTLPALKQWVTASSSVAMSVSSFASVFALFLSTYNISSQYLTCYLPVSAQLPVSYLLPTRILVAINPYLLSYFLVSVK